MKHDPRLIGSLRLAPLGIALVVHCDSAAALAAIEALCNRWRGPECDGAAPALELTVEVRLSSGIPGAPRIRADASRLELAGDGVRAWADARRGRAECLVSSGWAASADFAGAVIEPLLLFLLAQRDRTPIHASACMIDGIAIVLAGPAGTGKSCLAWAARQAGLPVLSDDTVHIQLCPDLQLWGLPRPIHLFPADAPDDAPGPLRRRNGKLKRALDSGEGHTLVARRGLLCLLARGEAVALEVVHSPAAPADIPPLEAGFDLVEAQSRAAYSALGARGFARLTLGADPHEAIAALLGHRAALAQIAA